MITLYSYYTETNESCVACGIYAHGDLETQLKYDVVCPLYNEEKNELAELNEDGHYDAILIHKEERIPVKIFYWSHMTTNKHKSHRGLVYLPDDIDTLEYAREKFEKRSYNL